MITADTPKDEQEEMNRIRDSLLALVKRHEERDHVGVACAGNRAAAVAFLAHGIGLSLEHLLTVAELMAEYTKQCRANK